MLDRIFEKAAQEPRGKSKLAKFLTRHHDEFAERLEQGPVSWQSLAKAFADEGLTDADGELPNAERLRRTWARVTKRVMEVREKAGKRSSRAPSSPPPPVVDLLPRQPAAPQERPPEATSSSDPMRRLADQLAGRKSKLPKPMD